MKLVRFVALLSLGAALAADEQVSVNLTPGDVLMQRLEAGRVSMKERQAAIRALFERVGCAVTEQPVNRQAANVICTLPGQTDSTVIVGAHYDFVSLGEGIIDDWSGTALLPSLYAALKDKPRRHTYQFVAFAAEEKGLAGSEHFVAMLSPEQQAEMQAFVNLECLGLAPPKVWLSRATPALSGYLLGVARTIHVPLEAVNVDGVGDDDSHPFLNKKLPVITIHSVTNETLRVLHSTRDNIKALRAGDYYDAYRLAAFYLGYLDFKLK